MKARHFQMQEIQNQQGSDQAFSHLVCEANIPEKIPSRLYRFIFIKYLSNKCANKVQVQIDIYYMTTYNIDFSSTSVDLWEWLSLQNYIIYI